MADEPLYVTFEFRGNLAEEVDRVKLGIAGLRNESARTYQRLIADSDEAFASMSKGNQRLAVSIQEDINSLRQLDAANKALDEGFARGTVTTLQYAEGKAKLAIQETDLRTGIQENIKVLQESIEQERMAEGSIESLHSSLRKMEEAWRKMSAAERESAAGQELQEKIRSLKEELSGLESDAGGATSGLRQFQTQLESVPGPLGQTAAAIGKVTKAALAFIATPLGMALAAIAAGLAAVNSWFHRTEEGENALAVATAAFNQVLGSLLDVVDKVGEWLYKAFTEPKKALSDLADFLSGQLMNRLRAIGKAGEAVWKILTGDLKGGIADFSNAWAQGLTGIEDAGRKASAWMADTNEKIKESVELQKRRNALDVAERDLLVERSRLEARIGELRDKAYDMSLPEAERSKALKEAIRLTDDLFAKEQAIAKEKYEITKAQNALANSNKADLRAEAEALAEVNRLEAQRYASRRMMLRQSNTLEGKGSRSPEKAQGDERKEIEAANALKAETARREREIERQKEALAEKEKDAELDLRQRRIGLMREGADKELEQIRLDYDRRIDEVERKGQEYVRAQQEIERAVWEKDNPDWKRQGLSFRPSTTSVSQLPESQRKKLEEAATIAATAREKAEADLLEKTLRQYQDHAAKRLELEKRYNEDVAYLTAQRTEANAEAIDAAIEEARRTLKKNLSDLSMEELKGSGLWDRLFGDLDRMATPSLEALLKQAREVNTSAWDPRNVKEYQDAIKRLEEAIHSRSPFKAIGDDWKRLLESIGKGDRDGMAAALEGMDTSVQSLTSSLDTIAGGIGDILGDEAGYAAKRVAELTSALSGFVSGAAKIAKGDILGGVTSVIGGIGKIFSMGRQVKEMNRQAREEQQKYYDEAITGELEYQRLLRERLRTQQEIGETTLAYNKRISGELERQRRASGSEYDRLLAQIQGEQYISGVGYRHGTWFRKAKTWNEYASLAGKSYEDIEKLYTEGKLEEKVAKLFEQLRALRDEGADIDRMLDDQEESMREVLTGTTTDSIADSIIRGFAEGKRSAKDFADDFQEMLNNAVLQGIKMKALEEPLRQWYESFAEASGAGLTESGIADLRAQYDKIIEDAARQLEDMERVTGGRIDSTLTQRARAGAYTIASQDSINETNGRLTSIQINVAETKECAYDMRTMLSRGLELQEEIARNTSYCRRLERIDNTLLEILRNGIRTK